MSADVIPFIAGNVSIGRLPIYAIL